MPSRTHATTTAPTAQAAASPHRDRWPSGQGAGQGADLGAAVALRKGRRVKVELALVHGKQEYDRRDDVKKREAQIESRHGQPAALVFGSA